MVKEMATKHRLCTGIGIVLLCSALFSCSSNSGTDQSISDADSTRQDGRVDLLDLPSIADARCETDTGPSIDDSVRQSDSAGDADHASPETVDAGSDLMEEPLPPYQPTGFVGADGKYFRDEQGRLLILRGVNVSNGNKGGPFFPKWFEQKHFDMLGGRGLNVVRFVLQWEAIEPEPGEFDQEYLDKVEQRVKWAAEAGLYVLLDMHQDIWGPKFGGNGAPEWATLDKGLPFDPPPGINWFMKYGEPAVCQAFQSLWDNEEGIGDHYAQAWAAVAKRFADDKTVIGYDLMNEPWLGNYGVMEVKEFEEEALVPFYSAVAQKIREVDQNHIIFVEPSATRSIGMTGGMGPIGDELVAFAPHYYHPTMDMLQSYSDSLENLEQIFLDLRDEAWAVGGPMLMGEWGFFIGNQGDVVYGEHQMALFEKWSLSFTAWSFDPGSGGFNLLSSDKKPLWSLEVLTGTYPARVNGRIENWHYERPTRTFSIAFDTTDWPSGETVIAVPEINYPEGLELLCAGLDGIECQPSHDEEQDTVIVPVSEELPGSYSVVISPAADHPMPIPGLSTHINIGLSPAQEQELQMEQDAGLRLVRTDFKWSKIEPEEGEFHFEKYDQMVENAASHDIEALALLDYSVGWAEAVPGDYSTIDSGKFGQFAAAVATQYKGKIKYYEVWNEENLDKFFKPEADPAKYGELLKAAYAGIKEADPEARVVFGGLNSIGVFTGTPWGFFDQAVRAHPDLGNYFDALAIHPYTLAQSLAPEQENPGGDYIEMLQFVRQALGRFGLERKPVMITEIGWPACPCPPVEPVPFFPNVSYEEQAAYLARSFILSWAAGIETYLWYDFIDSDGSNDLFSENYFGLVQYDPDPAKEPPPETKPAYHAFAALNSILEDHLYAGDFSPAKHCHAHRFQHQAGTVHAIWNSGDEECTVSIPVSAGVIGDVYNVTGAKEPDYVVGPGEALLALDPGSFLYVTVVPDK